MRYFVCSAVVLSLTAVVSGADEPESLLSLYEKTHTQQWPAALKELGKRGDDAVPILMEIWNTREKEKAIAAAIQVSCCKTGSKMVADVFCKVLRNSDDVERRRAAVDVLGSLRDADPPVIDALVVGLKDSNPQVRYWSLYALRPHRFEALRAAKPLVEMIEGLDKFKKGSFDEETRVHALRTLRLIDFPGHKEFILTRLVNTLRDKESSGIAQCVAAHDLGEIGADARVAIPELADISFNSKYDEARDQAKKALKKILQL